MSKSAVKKTALVNTNPYLSNPVMRETVTVMAVSTANRMEGIKVSRKVTREHYRTLKAEAEARS